MELVERETHRNKVLCLVLICACAWACEAPPGLQGFAPDLPAESASALDSPPAASIEPALETLPLEKEPEASVAASPVELPSPEEVRARVWEAGRLLLAGLPAVRSNERSAQSARSVEAMRVSLSDEGPLGEFWLAELARLLQQPYTGQDEIWSAAARSMGRLGNYAHSSLIALGLDARSFPGRVEAARDALHQLYGVWFKNEEEFEPYRQALGDPKGSQLLLKRALDNERVARERLLELFVLRPTLAVEWVGVLDPAIRIAAARSLGNALNQAQVGELDREALLTILFGRLEEERDPRALHALLSALVQLTETQALDSPEVLRLRKVLFGPHAALNMLARAQAMARLPWRMQGEVGDDHIYRAILDLGAMIRSLAESDRRRGSPDPDPMIEALVALQILCDRAVAAGIGDGLRGLQVRAELLALISGRNYSAVVRVAATDAYVIFMMPADWVALKAVMGEADGLPALRYAVLGLLHSLLLKFELDDEGSKALIDMVIAESGAESDPDLRRRALSVLGDPLLAPLIRPSDSSYLVQRFKNETVSDLALSVIGLLENYGRKEMLAPCMQSPRFGQLAADPNSLPALARMCAKLSKSEPISALTAARALAGVRSEGAPLGRLQQALELVAAIDPSQAESLDPAGHRQVCAWAWELQVLGTPLAEAHKLKFIKRLIRTHWPRSGPEPETGSQAFRFDEPARDHLLALLLAIEALSIEANDPALAAARAAANQAYQAATLSAPEHLGQVYGADLLLLVIRDHARYLHSTNQWPAALERFQFLVSKGALALPDLRIAMKLMTAIGDGTDRSGNSEALFSMQRSAILHPTWLAEPAALRMKDLRELSTSALQNSGAALSEAFVALLDGLPSSAKSEQKSADGGALSEAPLAEAKPAPVAEESSAQNAVWVGLVLDQGWLEELHELRGRHLEAIERLRLRSSAASPTAEGASPALGDQAPVEKKDD